ncbi:MAG: hypothetical protein JMN27_11720 [gamma proteobacterium endosymbiont of Lamellibrachia anaximandri]|nr:hypothetical protein [gamma proteobacterium endosymbiont of Lamellibrachia anaximandri]MBL3534490.1 hypothetical protein [gamma proteobacterium endosymbiont of Lamellibrachia anaximandri]
MKILSDDLKKILSGLANQDAGEFLSMREKMKVLGYGPETREKPQVAKRKAVKGPVIKRIALISDGRGLGTPLDYAIEACQGQNAQIDLLVHGAVDTMNISALESRIQQAGLGCQRIQLGANAVANLTDYICNHPSLIFLVSMPDDSAIKVLMEEIIPNRGSRLPVPLVLIEDRSKARPSKQSAA